MSRHVIRECAKYVLTQPKKLLRSMAASGHSAVRAFSLLRYGARSWCNRMIAATREAPLRQEIRFIGKSSATSSRLRWHGRQISVYRHFGCISSSHWVNWRGSNGGKRGLLHPRSPTALLQGMLGEIKSKLIAMTTIFGCCTDDVIVYVQCMHTAVPRTGTVCS